MASSNTERTRLKRKHDALTGVSPSTQMGDTEEIRSHKGLVTGTFKRIKLSPRGLETLEVLSTKRISIADINFSDKGCQARGTFGDVAAATLVLPRRGTRRKRRVAVKKLRFFGDDTKGKLFCDFVNELRLLEKVSHPNIVKVIGFVEDMENCVAWLIFNWEDNGNLRQFLLSRNWELPERISLVDDVAVGLEYLHTLQPPIRHGDLKSLNILVNSSNRAVITDFGSARIVEPGAASAAQPAASASDPTSKRDESAELKLAMTDNTLTLTGPACSVRWAAPECLQGQPLDLASDIWALGWIAWEAITDRFPFEEITSETHVLMKVIEGPLPEIHHHERLSQIHMLCSVMENCWKLEPKERLSATELRKIISFVPQSIPLATGGDHVATRSAGLLMEIGDIHRLHGRDEEALKIFEQGLAIARSSGHQIKLARLLSRKGEMLRIGSRCAEAERSFMEALEIYNNFGVDQGQADVLNGLGDVLTYQSRYIQAEECYTKALAIYNNTGDCLGQANALNGLGNFWIRQSNYIKAEASYGSAMAIYKSIGAGLGQANALTGLGDIRRECSKYIEAETCYDKALAIYGSIGNGPGRINALTGLGHVRRQQSKYVDAEVYYLEAIAISKRIGDELGRANALQGIGSIRRQQFKYIEAEAPYVEAIAIYNSIGDDLGQANALKGIGDVWMGQSRYAKAELSYIKARAIYEGIEDDLGQANALKALGDAMRQQSKYLEAEAAYVDALTIYQSIGEDLARENALKALGDVRRVLCRHIEGEGHYVRVQIIDENPSPGGIFEALLRQLLHPYKAEASYTKTWLTNRRIWNLLGLANTSRGSGGSKAFIVMIILRYTGWTRNEGDSSMEFASVPNDPQILLKSLRCGLSENSGNCVLDGLSFISDINGLRPYGWEFLECLLDDNEKRCGTTITEGVG